MIIWNPWHGCNQVSEGCLIKHFMGCESMILPKELTPSYITRVRSSWPPRVQSGNVEEGLYRI